MLMLLFVYDELIPVLLREGREIHLYPQSGGERSGKFLIPITTEWCFFVTVIKQMHSVGNTSEVANNYKEEKHFVYVKGCLLPPNSEEVPIVPVSERNAFCEQMWRLTVVLLYVL